MSATYPVSYTTVEDIYQTNPYIGSVSNVTSRNICYQIGRVENYINTKISKVYTVPLSEVPLILTTIATDLTIYELSKRFTTLQNQKSTDMLSRYKEAKDTLNMIVDNKLPLLDSSLQVMTKSSLSGLTPWSNNEDFTPTFNEQDMEESILDVDKDDD